MEPIYTLRRTSAIQLVLAELSDPLAGHRARLAASDSGSLHGSAEPLQDEAVLSPANPPRAGVTRTRAEGTTRLVSLRRDDLKTRFPG